MSLLCIGVFTVLTVFTGTVFSAATHDRFIELFNDRAPMQQVLAAVFDNDQATQLQHFQTIQEHINKGDAYLDYATKLKKAAQGILDSKLAGKGFKPVDIDKFMKAENDVASGESLEDKELERAVKEMMENRKRLKAATEEEKKAHLAAMTEAANAAFEEALSHESAQFQKPRAAEST